MITDTGTIAASHEAEAIVLDFYRHQALRKSPGSLAMFAAIRRASSLLSNLAAERHPGAPSKNRVPIVKICKGRHSLGGRQYL